MKTRCPHCETRFRVTESQLTSAHGYVRCGVCKEVFQITDDKSITDEASLDTTIAEIEYSGQREYNVDDEGHDNSLVDDLDDDFDHRSTLDESGTEHPHYTEADYIADDTDDAETHQPHDIDETPSQARINDDLHPEQDAQPDASTEQESPADQPVTATYQEESTDDAKSLSTQEDSETDAEHIDLDGKRSDAARTTTDKLSDDSFDLFDEHGHSAGHVVPEEFRGDYRHSNSSVLATSLWSFGILLLIATLFLEHLWFNRDEYARVPEIRAEIEKLCAQINCSDISIRVPEQIELVSRNVYSHPNNEDGLIVDVTMKNNATFAQPYPVLKIEFSDIRGQVMASRNFLPDQYLSIVQQNTDDDATLPPQTTSSITLEVVDPGEQAKTYEFEFL